MCFSASASFIAGTGLVTAGALVLRRTRQRTELPYAAIPLAFGVQQLIEGVIWLTFDADAALLNPAMTFAYSLFSHVFWPLYVPFAALLMEPDPGRRKWMAGFAVAGALSGFYLLANMLRFPIESRDIGGHIEYASPHFYVVPVMAGYLAGTCLSLLFSSHRYVAIFGAAALASFAFSYLFYTRWLISIWCFFAAVLSGIVLLHFVERRKVAA